MPPFESIVKLHPLPVRLLRKEVSMVSGYSCALSCIPSFNILSPLSPIILSDNSSSKDSSCKMESNLVFDIMVMRKQSKTACQQQEINLKYISFGYFIEVFL
mmetsp:Transcript_2843/g.5327  ORF Transcript_2843/g.5327 Transcript_2843/m.5327 type:complete len:102 (+) Transcript_2843:951-1256(+)